MAQSLRSPRKKYRSIIVQHDYAVFGNQNILTLALVRGRFYFWGGRLNAVDAKTGQVVWEFNPKRAVYATPAIADGVVYVSSTDGSVYALQ